MQGIHNMNQQQAYSAFNAAKEYEAMGIGENYEVRGFVEREPSADLCNRLCCVQRQASMYSSQDGQYNPPQFKIAHPGLTLIAGALAGFGSFPIIPAVLGTGLTLLTLNVGVPVIHEHIYRTAGITGNTGYTALIKTGAAAVAFGIAVLLSLSLQR